MGIRTDVLAGFLAAGILFFGTYPGYCETAMDESVTAEEAAGETALVDGAEKDTQGDEQDSGVAVKESDIPGTTLSRDVIEKIKEEIREEMRLEDKNWLDRMHLSVPEWTKRTRLYGDFRVRYEGIFYSGENGLIVDPQDTSALINTRVDEKRYRTRARLGLVTEINPQADFEIRLASGSSNNPTSTNDTLGDYLNKDSVLIDLAYLKLLPMPSKPWLSAVAGRFPSPFIGTDLVWDGDLAFEGLAVSYDTRKTRTIGPIAVVGAFPLQEEEWYADKWLFGGQLGFEYRHGSDLSFVLTSAYYHYENIKGTTNPAATPNINDWTKPLYQQKGNTLINISADADSFTPGIASDFRLVDMTAYVDCAWYYPVHVKLTANVVENLGFDKDELIRRTGVSNIAEDTTGMKVELMVGHSSVRSFGEWQWTFAYKYLGADAVLDAFTDSDFHMGGTNAKGWTLKGSLGIMKNIWLDAQWITANEIKGPQLSIDQLQLDLNIKF